MGGAVGRLCMALGSLAGLFVAGYTGVLLSVSNQPDTLWLADGHFDPWLVLAGIAVPAQCHAAFDQARRQRERDRLTAPFELWARVGPPRGREHWRNVLETAEGAGATGILVPADPRLLDLLRNADEEEDRSDLTLAQG